MEIPHFDFDKGEIWLVDKPFGWTSFDVVNKLKKATRLRKIGHAGTLDPLATGLLVVCAGRQATKQIDTFLNDDKQYTGTITFGATRPSYDMETEADAHFDLTPLTPQQISAAAAQMVGNIDQIPPMHSAIKVDGKRLYKSARKGIAVAVQPRPISIHRFELTRIVLPEVDFDISCSKGTYIRSIAHDLGKAVANGAYLSALRRVRSGNFDIAHAWQLPDLLAAIGQWTAAQHHAPDLLSHT